MAFKKKKCITTLREYSFYISSHIEQLWDSMLFFKICFDDLYILSYCISSILCWGFVFYYCSNLKESIYATGSRVDDGRV